MESPSAIVPWLTRPDCTPIARLVTIARGGTLLAVAVRPLIRLHVFISIVESRRDAHRSGTLDGLIRSRRSYLSSRALKAGR